MSDPFIDLEGVLPVGFWQGVPTETEEETGPKGMSTESSVSESEAQAPEEDINPSVPNLMIPLMTVQDWNYFISNGQEAFQNVGAASDVDASRMVSLMMSNLTTDLLDKWSESLKKVSDQKALQDKKVDAFLDGVRQDIQNQQVNAAAATMVAMMIVGTGVVTGGMEGIVSEGTVAFNVISEAIAPVAQFVPNAMLAELGLIGAFYAAMAMYQAALITPALEKDNHGEQTIDELAAKAYTEVLVKTLDDPRFNAQLIQKIDPESKLSDAMRTQTVVVMKLVLLMTSLALLYKTETGGLTEEEIGDLLKGKIELKEGDMKGAVVTMIRTMLTQIPTGEREKILDAMLTYFHGNPAVEELADPAKVFHNIFQVGGLDIGSQHAV